MPHISHMNSKSLSLLAFRCWYFGYLGYHQRPRVRSFVNDCMIKVKSLFPVRGKGLCNADVLSRDKAAFAASQPQFATRLRTKRFPPLASRNRDQIHCFRSLPFFKRLRYEFAYRRKMQAVTTIFRFKPLNRQCRCSCLPSDITLATGCTRAAC